MSVGLQLFKCICSKPNDKINNLTSLMLNRLCTKRLGVLQSQTASPAILSVLYYFRPTLIILPTISNFTPTCQLTLLTEL